MKREVPSSAYSGDPPRRVRTTATMLGLVSAAPTIAWGLVGSDFLTDDFVIANGFASDGLLERARDLAFAHPVRPGVVPYFLLVYEGIGERMLIQVLLLAVINAAAAILLWLALRAVVSHEAAMTAAFVFAAVPNRGSTRLWFVIGSNLIAVICVLAGTALFLRKDRIAPAVGLFLLGILTYESVAAVAGLAIAWWWWEDRRVRLPRAAASLSLMGGTALVLWYFSPKRDAGGPGAFEHMDTIGHGQFGTGFWGNDAVGWAALVVVLIGVTACVASLLPSFRPADTRVQRDVLVGVVVTAVALVPFVIGGAEFAVNGIFDRNNLLPDLGSCLIVGALLAALTRRTRRPGIAVSVVVIAWLTLANVPDVRDYGRAVTDGQDLVDQLVADVDPTIGTVVVTPPLPGTAGVDQFILDGDLTSALQLRRGRAWSSVDMPLTVEGCLQHLEQADARTPTYVYNRSDRTLTASSGISACAGR